MGVRFRKSVKAGPLRVNLSKSGVGWSVGGKGFRYTKTATGRTRKTYSIPGTGISYVTEKGNNKRTKSAQPQYSPDVTSTKKELEDYTDLFFDARDIEKEHPDEALEKYMDILSRFKPDGTIYYERPAILLERNKRYEEAIEVCQLALKNLKANNPSTYEGTKQEFTKRIERCKVKIAKANGTWKPEPKPDMPKVQRPTEQELIAEIKPDITPNIVFPDWYVSVSFGYSKSENFSKIPSCTVLVNRL